MNRREQGFLLLTSHLGEPDRKPLTVAQLRRLATCVSGAVPSGQDRELSERDLIRLGLGADLAQKVFLLLSQEELLDRYLSRAEAKGCRVLTRVSPAYPGLLRLRLGTDAPGCLWVKGDLSFLSHPSLALVGSRELRPDNRQFAEAVGTKAAEQGYVLISGNARGADRTAQESCLAAGGKVVTVIADELETQKPDANVLYISEDGFDLPFTPVRALSRNRVIHALGWCSLVAQCTLGKGGTWDGTVRHLKRSHSRVFCFRDGTDASDALIDRGADGISIDELTNLNALTDGVFGLFDQ